LADQQKLEIAKAVIRKPKVLVLDEPTSALNERDVNWLFELVNRLRDSGTSVVYISHKMAEIRRIATRVLILRNGANVGDYLNEEVTDSEIIRLMIGRSQEAFFPPRRQPPSSTEPVLRVYELSVPGRLSGVSLALYKGEVLGVAGLEGQGQRELFQALFGLIASSRGDVFIHEKKAQIRRPSDAMYGQVRIGLVPEDHKTEGLFLNMSTKENMSLPILDQFSRLGFMRTRLEGKRVLEEMKHFNIAACVRDLPVSSLSGGNQQKVVIGKWMMTGAQILLFYDPTRGVDVGTKSEIYQLVRTYTEEGGSVLFYSSELPELLSLSDRILVFYAGGVVCELTGEAMTQETVMAACVGHGAATT
jgi:ribose transport system ATP-binding protein